MKVCFSAGTIGAKEIRCKAIFPWSGASESIYLKMQDRRRSISKLYSEINVQHMNELYSKEKTLQQHVFL